MWTVSILIALAAILSARATRLVFVARVGGTSFISAAGIAVGLAVGAILVAILAILQHVR